MIHCICLVILARYPGIEDNYDLSFLFSPFEHLSTLKNLLLHFKYVYFLIKPRLMCEFLLAQVMRFFEKLLLSSPAHGGGYMRDKFW